MHRLLGRGLAPLIVMTAVVLLSGCSLDSASGTGDIAATPATILAPLTERLVFAGDISGAITSGIDPRPLTHDNPVSGTPPRFTQCSTFASLPGSDTIDDYVAVIVGNAGGSRYVVEVEINMDNPAYTTPGTKLLPEVTNTGGSVQVIEVGGQNRSWQQVFGPTSQEPAVIILHADRKSGTVDAWMATTDQSQKDATSHASPSRRLALRGLGMTAHTMKRMSVHAKAYTQSARLHYLGRYAADPARGRVRDESGGIRGR